ncbi:MAG: Oligosaccharyl transferase [Devosia sp.]|nr:Oligosaccharyl transferase [Devosia sp.]
MLDRQKHDLLALAFVFLAALAFIAVRASYHGFDQVFFADNDDAMRMVVVRDFLSGQNWFDHAQYRMNTPFGAAMHWSRLVDLPIAIVELLGRPLVGAAQAEIVAGYVWPSILLAVFIWLSGRLARLLVGAEGVLPGMLLSAFSIITFSEFNFGRVDHHSVQIILTQVAAIATITALRRPGAAIGAGLAVATSLAIGIETLPVVIAAVAIYGLVYVASPIHARAIRNFGLSFGLGTLLHLGVALPPSLWFVPACDAISIVYVTAALAVGLGLSGLSLLPLDTRPRSWRLGAAVIAGSAALALVLVLFPKCLAGPYASVDPWLVQHWLAGVGEAKPLLAVLSEQPSYVVAAAIPTTLALFVYAYEAWRTRGVERGGWLAMLALLAVIAAVALLQVRGIRLSAAVLSPACGYLVIAARARYLRRTTALSVLGLIGSWLGFAGLLWAVLVQQVVLHLPAQTGARVVTSAELDSDACLAPGAYVDLKGMPPERIMTPIDLGAYVLLYTDHAVVAAPYHRNNQGLLDTFHFFNGPISEARAILDARGISLVVTCDALPEMSGLPDAAPDAFVHLARANALPPWFSEVKHDGPLRIYAVLPQ